MDAFFESGKMSKLTGSRFINLKIFTMLSMGGELFKARFCGQSVLGRAYKCNNHAKTDTEDWSSPPTGRPLSNHSTHASTEDGC